MTKRRALKTVEQIYELASARKAVAIRGLHDHVAAAWVINMPAPMLIKMLRAGRITEYKSKKK